MSPQRRTDATIAHSSVKIFLDDLTRLNDFLSA
jgi:hypothetical protein